MLSGKEELEKTVILSKSNYMEREWRYKRKKKKKKDM